MEDTKLVGIRKSWSFVEFVHKYGTLKVASLINSETGEPFINCTLFRKGKKPNKRLYYSKNLGELTGAQLSEMKQELNVILLTNGRYKICKQKETAWETVDI